MTDKSRLTPPIVMTIAGSDSGGGAGIAADLKTFAALGVHGTFAITSVTSQNTTGVLSTFDLPPEVVSSQIDAVCEDMEIKWAKTGMLASSEIIKAVAKQIKKHNLFPVIDPVMAAEAGGDLLRKEALSVLIEELLPLCKVTTPNASEASALAGIPVKTPEDARVAARKIAEFGVNSVIVTGGHLDATDLLYEANSDKFTRIPGTFIKGGTHGSGCTYAAAMTAYLASGENLQEAAKKAKKFVEQAILKSQPVGKGVGPVNPLGSSLEDKERFLVLKNLKEAVSVLKASPQFLKLIPEVGCNIAMAIPGADSLDKVAAVEDRIIKGRRGMIPVGCINFGASRHMGRFLLSALRYDPRVRAAINIKYSEKNLSACEKAGLSISSFERKEEPENINNMDWETDRGTVEAIRKYEEVPTVIYDKGSIGIEPMIRLLGRDAVEVANLAVSLAEKLE